MFPQCLQRPEGVSDELARTWLNNVREAKPIFEHPLRTALPMAVLPVICVLGGAWGTWRARRATRDVLTGWAAVTLFCLFAAVMLLWQIRAGPAAQLLAIHGSTLILWVLVPWCLEHRLVIVRVLGSVAAFLGFSGLFAGLVLRYLPIDEPSPRVRIINRAASLCAFQPNLAVLDRLPATTLFTHVDLGPRLITMTHHRGIAGPYHRNEGAILDVHRAFKGTPENFLRIAAAHGATHLLTCPNLAETTIYRARAPGGFYSQLAQGRIPAWLVPVRLPANSPFRLWRIAYPAARPAAQP